MIRYDFSQIPVIENGRKVEALSPGNRLQRRRLEAARLKLLAMCGFPSVSCRSRSHCSITSTPSLNRLPPRSRRKRIGDWNRDNRRPRPGVASLAKPFVKLEEIEVRLRDIIDRTLDIERSLRFSITPKRRSPPRRFDLRRLRLPLPEPGSVGRFGLNADRTIFRTF